jgi:hypothetical protein
MTRQYLVGELSQILGDLEGAAAGKAALREIACLRREAETTPPAELAPVVERAMALGDRVCWETLERGDAAAFLREAAICVELRAFGVSARLMTDDENPP